MQATIEISEEHIPALEIYRDRLDKIVSLGLAQVKLREALRLLEDGKVSLGHAAELAELSRDEIARQAYAIGISPRWDEDDLKAELGLGKSFVILGH